MKYQCWTASTLNKMGYFVQLNTGTKRNISMYPDYQSSYQELVNKGCYVAFEGALQSCRTTQEMELVVNQTLTRDFPAYNFTAPRTNTTVYINILTADTITYQHCYSNGRLALLYKQVECWYLVFFFCSLPVFYLGVRRVSSTLGPSEVLGVVTTMIRYLMEAPWHIINCGFYVIIALVMLFCFNCTMPSTVEEFLKSGGILTPLAICWKKKSCSSIINIISIPKKPLDVLGKIVWIGGFVGIIITGIFLLHPITAENTYKEGVCYVSKILFVSEDHCTFTGPGNALDYYYWCVNLQGYFIKPTGYTNDTTISSDVFNNRIITDTDLRSKKFSTHYIKSNYKSTNDECYVTFGIHQDYPCNTSSNMEIIINQTLAHNFPKHNFRLNSSYFQGRTLYTTLPIIYQKCYYSQTYDLIILHTVAVMWAVVPFISCWFVVLVGTKLMAKYGQGLSQDYAQFVIKQITGVLYLGWYFTNVLIYLIASIFSNFFYNQGMQSSIEQFIEAGGVCRVFVKCYQRCYQRCSALRDNYRDNDPDSDPVVIATNLSSVVIQPPRTPPLPRSTTPTTTPPRSPIHRTDSVPHIITVYDYIPSFSPPSPRFGGFDLHQHYHMPSSNEMVDPSTPSNIEPPPSYDAVMSNVR